MSQEQTSPEEADPTHRDRPLVTASGERLLSTRTLMTCAAIAVGASVFSIPVAWAEAAVGASLPVLYAAMAGAWVFGSVLAQALLRQGGVALVTAVLMGLISAITTPLGWSTGAGFVLIGLLLELPFLCVRYRRWPTWLFLPGPLLVGFLFNALPLAFVLRAGALQPIAFALVLTLPLVSCVLATVLAIVIARRLRRAGLGPQQAP
ncbi:ECF transporter S component [Tsukamurella sp. 8F]|uniref:ECF transporter S component n=1 Tax=unclassified Tsukamurella TaxID=2633480 RepID=UPI0023B9AEC3|nr:MULTISPECIES: ECF transporter S component [unclassified Tsukamurella]MDF0532392.1 ECF transporter S component [Tsukamurella sp. 8J]MDF0588622.1 ECF transporter S component [Tsukamurella sp. 8F]